jgi:hypothetical protein
MKKIGLPYLLGLTPVLDSVCKHLAIEDITMLSSTSRSVRSSMSHQLYARSVDGHLKSYFSDPEHFRVLLRVTGTFLVGDVVLEYMTSKKARSDASWVCFNSGGGEPGVDHVVYVKLMREYLLSEGAEETSVQRPAGEVATCGCSRIDDQFTLHGRKIMILHSKWRSSVKTIVRGDLMSKVPTAILTHYGSYLLYPYTYFSLYDGPFYRRKNKRGTEAWAARSLRRVRSRTANENVIDIQKLHNLIFDTWRELGLWQWQRHKVISALNVLTAGQ